MIEDNDLEGALMHSTFLLHDRYHLMDELGMKVFCSPTEAENKDCLTQPRYHDNISNTSRSLDMSLHRTSEIRVGREDSSQNAILTDEPLENHTPPIVGSGDDSAANHGQHSREAQMSITPLSQSPRRLEEGLPPMGSCPDDLTDLSGPFINGVLDHPQTPIIEGSSCTQHAANVDTKHCTTLSDLAVFADDCYVNNMLRVPPAVEFEWTDIVRWRLLNALARTHLDSEAILQCVMAQTTRNE